MFDHFKKSASILTDQENQMVGSDQWPATICKTEKVVFSIATLFRNDQMS